MWKFKRAIRREGWTEDKHNSDLIPQTPKFELHFINTETGQLSIGTDLNSKLYRRNKKLTQIYNFYLPYIRKRQVTTLLYCVYDEDITSIQNEIRILKKKFKKYRIPILGHYWQRDIGEKEFKVHYHIIVFTQRFNTMQCQEINALENKGSFILCKTLKGFTNYLKEKELFGKKHSRTSSCSLKLLAPNT